MLQLWVHESLRVFGDRMWDSQDLGVLDSAINERLIVNFSTSHEELFAGSTACPPFASFLHAGSRAAYQPVTDMQARKVAARSSEVRGVGTHLWQCAQHPSAVQEFLTERLDVYNGSGNPVHDIVLFRRVCWQCMHRTCSAW